MTKDVLITISGLQLMIGEESSPIEVITTGEYYLKNGKHYILYEEVMEDFDGITKNRIKIGDGRMDIFKNGVSRVHMVFEKNKKNLTSYQTPYGNLMLGIEASRLHIEQEENNIDIKVKYDLDVNYEHLAECTLAMNIKPRDTKDFLLNS